MWYLNLFFIFEQSMTNFKNSDDAKWIFWYKKKNNVSVVALNIFKSISELQYYGKVPHAVLKF